MTLKQFLTDILHFPSKQCLGLHFKDFWISKNYRAPTFSAELSNQIGKKKMFIPKVIKPRGSKHNLLLCV